MAKSGLYTKSTQVFTRWIVYHIITNMQENLIIDGNTSKPMQDSDPQPRCVVEIWNPNQEHNQMVNDLRQISKIDLAVFGHEYGWSIVDAHEYMVDTPRSITVILRDPQTKEVVGYTVANPTTSTYQSRIYKTRQAAKNVAYISNTAIKTEYRGHHYTQKLMNLLEIELRAMDYDFVDRDSADESIDGQPSYADKVIKNNSGRIVFEKKWNTPLGMQRYIRMNIAE